MSWHRCKTNRVSNSSREAPSRHDRRFSSASFNPHRTFPEGLDTKTDRKTGLFWCVLLCFQITRFPCSVLGFS